MTVKQLIKKLQKMPQNADVAMTAHDNRILEVQGFVREIELRDFDEIREEIGHQEFGFDYGITGKVVVLIP